jgi:hypothetical protein
MNTFEINTSAWSEENFTIVTDLTKEQIIQVIAGMVHHERKSDTLYENEDYINELKKQFPKATIIFSNPELLVF